MQSTNEKFIIDGGNLLSGKIVVLGAKNSATPILSACLLTEEECIIDNLPKIEDVFRMIEILKSMGVLCEWLSDRKIKIAARDIDANKIDYSIISKLRSSILLWGSLCGRITKFNTGRPGGCVIGSRTIAPHINALANLNINITDDNKTIIFDSTNLKGNDFTMSEISVTATENAILAAVLAKGKTTIRCAVTEPHVQDLCYFLISMGAKISGVGTSTLLIDGVAKLHGANVSLIPDPIEMGTFISLVASAKSEVTINNVVLEFILMEMQKFQEVGIKFEKQNIRKGGWGYQICDLKILKSDKLTAIDKVHNMPFPGFASDNLPPFAVLATQLSGETLIHDWMYEGRMNYLNNLQKMGAQVNILNRHEAIISGPYQLNGQEITSYDLRAGASLVIASAIASGKSIISDVYQIDRGYESIEVRLSNIGVNIKRE